MAGDEDFQVCKSMLSSVVDTIRQAVPQAATAFSDDVERSIQAAGNIGEAFQKFLECMFGLFSSSLEAARRVSRLMKDLIGEPGGLNPYLMSNYAPQHKLSGGTGQLQPTYGEIPRELSGTFLMVGPNSPDPVPDQHWFDGDGMLHATYLKGGAAYFQSSYIETKRYKQEREVDAPINLRVGMLHGIQAVYTAVKWLADTMLAGQNPVESVGYMTANTNIAVHEKQLFALHDLDLPYELELALDEELGHLQITTKGMVRLGNVQKTFKITPEFYMQFSPHPRYTYLNGTEHLVSFSYNGINITEPEYCIRVFDGPLGNRATCYLNKVSLPRRPNLSSIQSMTHDFATTANYVIVVDSPFFMDLKHSMYHNVMPFYLAPNQAVRFGVYKSSDLCTAESADSFADSQPLDGMWFSSQFAGVMLHVADAWEEKENDEVVAIKVVGMVFRQMDLKKVALMEPAELFLFDLPLKGKHPSPDPNKISGRATYKRFLREGTRMVKGEYPTPCIKKPHPDGGGAEVIYVATAADFLGAQVFDGIAKIDMKKREVVKVVKHAEAVAASRPAGEASSQYLFAGQPGYAAVGPADGYLMSYVYDAQKDASSKAGEPKGTSELVIYATTDMTVVARVALPHRVPYGIHSLWASDSELPVKPLGGALAKLAAELRETKKDLAALTQQVASLKAAENKQ